MSKKSEDLKTYISYLGKWENLSSSRRYNIFRRAHELFGEKNPLLEITDEETVKRDYNQYQRETRRKSTQRSSQPTTDASDELKQLSKRLEALEKTSGGQQLNVDDLDNKLDEMGLFDDLDNLKNKIDTVIDESTNKYLKIKSKLAELTEAHHKCKARHTIFKHNELKNEERFKRLESELEQERLLRKNLERQYDELFCLVHEKLKL